MFKTLQLNRFIKTRSKNANEPQAVSSSWKNMIMGHVIQVRPKIFIFKTSNPNHICCILCFFLASHQRTFLPIEHQVSFHQNSLISSIVSFTIQSVFFNSFCTCTTANRRRIADVSTTYQNLFYF